MSTLKVTNINAADGISALSIANGTGKVSLATNSDLALQGTGKVFAPNGIVFSSTEITTDDASTTNRTESSNLLDDYEEGTWTPNIYGSSTSGTYTPSNVYAYYRKIGTQVTVWCDVSFSVATGGSGSIRISGLPFNYRSSMGVSLGPLWLSSVNTTSASSISSGVAPSTASESNEIFPVLLIDNASFEEIPITGVTTSSRLGFMYTYISA